MLCFLLLPKELLANGGNLADMRKAYIENQAQKRKLKFFFYKKPVIAWIEVSSMKQSDPLIINPLNQIENVDIIKVRNTWIGWYNDVRNELWLTDYEYDSRLDRTALEWSNTAKEQWFISHKRNPNDSYYDYWKIDAWFQERWIVAKNINRITHTENIGYGTYSCKKSDCTDTLINSIRSTFNFFMSEKGKQYDAHYKSIIKKEFQYIGLWIRIDPKVNRYYLTVHYITDFK